MSSFLDTLKLEVENKNVDGRCMKMDIGPDETVVGEVPAEVRPLYVLYLEWAKMAAEESIKVSFSGDPEERKDHAIQAERLAKRSMIAKEIFWTSLKDSFDLWGKRLVGVRTNWKVVYSDKPTAMHHMPPGMEFPGEI